MPAVVASGIIEKALEHPEVYSAVLIDMVQKVGFTAACALVLLVFVMAMAAYLLYHVTQGYTLSIRVLNDQNKRYQDFFLEDRAKSGKLLLNEHKDRRNTKNAGE